MKFIGKENMSYFFEPTAKPVASVKPGETFQVETEDAFGALIKKDEDGTPEVLEQIEENGNPLTGPICIEGAEPGDTLAIHIEKIKPGNYGVSILAEDFSPIGHCWKGRSVTKVVKVDENYAYLNEWKIPLEPMIGTIGVACAKEVYNGSRQGHYCGNVDCKEIGNGSTLFLPVFVKGANLYMGDVHGVQGDGEMCNPFEVPSVITLSVDVIKGCKTVYPRVIRKDKLVSIVTGLTFENTASAAYLDMANWICEKYHLDFDDVCFLMGQVADVRACQIANTFHTARCEVPKHYFEK